MSRVIKKFGPLIEDVTKAEPGTLIAWGGGYRLEGEEVPDDEPMYLKLWDQSAIDLGMNRTKIHGSSFSRLYREVIVEFEP